MQSILFYSLGHGGLSSSGDQGGGVTVAESLGSEELSVARAAVDLTVRSVASQRRVEWAMALGTVEALLVPHRALSQLLLGSKHSTAATWAALSLLGHDRGRVRIVEGSFRGNLILAKITEKSPVTIESSRIFSLFNSRQTISLQETGTAAESVAVGSPLLSVAGPAVHITIRSVATDDRVQLLSAVLALVALAMPFATLGQHLLSGIDHATATRASLTRTRLDDGRVDARDQRSNASASRRLGRY